jgi:hypothetical protein
MTWTSRKKTPQGGIDLSAEMSLEGSLSQQPGKNGSIISVALPMPANRVKSDSVG